MSTPILPFAVWAPGTNQNSVPANDNSLRNQILNGLVISDSTDAQPGSPADGDIYIITGAATGTQWATFDEFDLAIFDSGTWYAYAPVEGIRVNIAGVLNAWDGAAYAPIAGGAGVDSVNGRTGAVVLTAADVPAEIVTDATTSRTLTAADAGKYIRFTNSAAKTLTVEDVATQAQTLGHEFHGRNANTGDLTITESGSTVNPPAGGTLVVPPQGTFTLKYVGSDTWDLFGVTVAA